MHVDGNGVYCEDANCIGMKQFGNPWREAPGGGGSQLICVTTGRQSKHSGQARTAFGPLRQSGGSEQNGKVPDKNALTTASESLNHPPLHLASFCCICIKKYSYSDAMCLLNTYHIYTV